MIFKYNFQMFLFYSGLLSIPYTYFVRLEYVSCMFHVMSFVLLLLHLIYVKTIPELFCRKSFFFILTLFSYKWIVFKPIQTSKIQSFDRQSQPCWLCRYYIFIKFKSFMALSHFVSRCSPCYVFITPHLHFMYVLQCLIKEVTTVLVSYNLYVSFSSQLCLIHFICTFQVNHNYIFYTHFVRSCLQMTS